LKGKLQSEVDLIKGARGKWAYTFYDQRKKKKERRYWPSQSSGPVIEDPCNCDKCSPNNTAQIVSNDEEFSSSPSTEEVEYEIIQPSQQYSPLQMQQMQQMQHLRQQQSEYQQIGMPSQYFDQQNQLVYYMQPNGNYYQGNDQQQYLMKEYQKNMINLKSSNDFQQDNRNHYLKSSNDFMVNHQRPWENYFQTNNMEYNQDGFLENNFL